MCISLVVIELSHQFKCFHSLKQITTNADLMERSRGEQVTLVRRRAAVIDAQLHIEHESRERLDQTN